MVALVAGEEAVEDLAAVPGELLEAGADCQRVVEQREGVVEPGGLDVLLGDLAAPGAEAVDAGAPGELGEPRPDRGVVPEACPAARTPS